MKYSIKYVHFVILILSIQACDVVSTNRGTKEGVVERMSSDGGKCYDTYANYSIVSEVCYYNNGIKKRELFWDIESHYDKYGRLRKRFFNRNDLIPYYSHEYEEKTKKTLEAVWVEEHYYRTGERRLCVSLAGVNETLGGRGYFIGEPIYYYKNGNIMLKANYNKRSSFEEKYLWCYNIYGNEVDCGKESFLMLWAESETQIEEDSR